MVGLPKQCHTTNLFSAMNICETEIHIKKLKLGFFKRLLSNQFTSQILKQLFMLKYLGCFDQEIKALLKLSDNVTIEEAQLAAELKIGELNKVVTELKDDNKLNNTAKRIRELVHSSKANASIELFDLLKY
jgi:hypothetical protein